MLPWNLRKIVHHFFSTQEKLWVLFLIFLVSAGCGKSTDEKRDDAILSANILLTKQQCDAAISLLEGVGRDVNNVNYLKALASGYACKGGFNVLRFYQDDLPFIGNPGPMGGFSRFGSSASMTTPSNSAYNNLQTAINLLLYAGGIPTDEDPTPSRRANNFTFNEAGELNAMLMYTILVQLGRYIKFYGDTNASGVKAGGALTSECFTDYQNLDFAPASTSGSQYDNIVDFLGAGLTGSCNLHTDVGHPDLGTEGNYNIARMCQGVILMNNLLAIFPSVIAGIAGSNFANLSSLESTLNTAKASVETHTPGSAAAVNSVYSQTRCETLNASNDDFLQTYFLFIMETMVQ